MDRQASQTDRGVIHAAAGFIILVGLGIAVVAGVFVTIGARETLNQARLIRDAEPVRATVLASEVVRSTTTQGSGASRTTSTSYFPSVEFAYDVGGQRHTGDRVWPVGQGGDSAWARSIVQRYPDGAGVEAWVDPADADSAFLEKRWTVGPYVMVFAGSMGLGFLISLVAGAALRAPTVAGAAMLLGVLAWAAAPAWAYAHFLLYANPSGDPPVWLAYALAPYFVGIALPITLWRLGQRWRRKLEADEDPAGG